jgi:hypothetical protein
VGDAGALANQACELYVKMRCLAVDDEKILS